MCLKIDEDNGDKNMRNIRLSMPIFGIRFSSASSELFLCALIDPRAHRNSQQKRKNQHEQLPNRNVMCDAKRMVACDGKIFSRKILCWSITVNA